MFFGLLAFLLLVPLTLLLLVPFGFALTSFRNLLTLPIEMLKVTFDKRRRRNHALEHATINVLEERFASKMLVSGFAEPDSFLIRGPVNPQAVLAAAHEGLQRLQAGETRLAFYPRGSTMVVSGQLISAITFFVVLLLLQNLSFGSLILAMFAAMLTARGLAIPIGLFLQRFMTTSADVQGMRIDRLDTQMPQNAFAMILSGGTPMQFRVWTHHVQVASPTEPKRYKAY